MADGNVVAEHESSGTKKPSGTERPAVTGKPAVTEKPSPPKAAAVDRIRVLTIEDNEGYAKLVEEMLSEAEDVSFEVEWKDTLKAGLERIEQGQLDIILLDLVLPDSPRRAQTLAQVKEKAQQVPIVVLTVHADESFAINAVRRGAQDYLVKRNVDSPLLVRTIRYAMARSTGEERSISQRELGENNGKEGKPTYIAHNGKVYDVSRSKLWRNGAHMKIHQAGHDLTANLAAAPHGEEVFLGVHLVGELVREETRFEKIITQIEKLHLHPISVHFTTAYSMAVSLFTLLSLLIPYPPIELASWFMLILAFMAAPASILTGTFSWKASFGGKMNNIFRNKIAWAFILFVVLAVAFVLRFTHSSISEMGDLRYIYIALVLFLTPCVTILGYYGGKIAYS